MNPSTIPSANSYQPYNYTPYGSGVSDNINTASSALNGNSQGNTSAIPTTKSSGNWFTHLLPTIGSIGLPMLATALAPETGGLSLLGGPAARILFAGAGSAIGKGAEDAATGNPINGLDLLNSAVQGSAGQAIGEGLAKGLGLVGGAAKGIITGQVDKNAVKATEDLATQQAGQKATIYNEAVQASKNPNIGKTFQSTLDHAQQTYGIDPLHPNAPQLMSEVGHSLTGGNIESGQGAYNDIVDQIINNHPGTINLDDISNELNQSVSNLNSASGTSGELSAMTSKGKQLVPAGNPAQQAVQQISLLSPKLSTSGGTGLTASEMTSSEADSLAKGLQHIAFSPVPTASTGFQDPVALAKKGIANDLYNYVRGEVDNQPGLNDLVQNVKNDPNLESFVNNKVAGISDPAVQATTKQQILDTLGGVSRVQDLRAAQADAVKMSQLGDQVNNFNTERTYTKAAPGRDQATQPNNSSNTNLLDMGSLLGIPYTGGLSAIGLVPHAIKAIKDPATVAMVNKLTDSGVAKSVASKIPSLLTGASQFITHANDLQPNAVNLNLGNNNMNNQPALDPNSMNSLLLRLAIADAANPNTQGASSSIMNNVLPQIQSANQLQPLLTGTETAAQQAGGGQGGIMGNLSKLLARFSGGPAGQYEQQRQQLMQALSGTPTSPGILPGASVPDITGNNTSMVNQFQMLQQLLANRRNGASVLGGLPQ